LAVGTRQGTNLPRDAEVTLQEASEAACGVMLHGIQRGCPLVPVPQHTAHISDHNHVSHQGHVRQVV